MNDLTPERKRFWLGVSGDTEWERLAGLTFPGTYALMARRYFHEFDSTHDDLVHISVKNHMQALVNQVGHIRKDVSFEKAKNGFTFVLDGPEGLEVVEGIPENLLRKILERM